MGRVKTDTRLAREQIEAEIAQRRAATAEHVAAASRHVMAVAMEGGLIAGLGLWVHSRMGAVLDNSRLTRGGSTSDNSGWTKNLGTLPGVKAWISDEIGLIAGPVVASQLPKGLHDNGLFIADHFLQAGAVRLPPEVVARVTSEIAREGWFEAVWVHYSETTTVTRSTAEVEEALRVARRDGATEDQLARMRADLEAPYDVSIPLADLAGVRLMEPVRVMISVAFSLAVVGFLEVAKAVAKAVVP